MPRTVEAGEHRLTIDGNKIYHRDGEGEPVATVDEDENQVYEGSEPEGVPVATIRGDQVYEGGYPLTTPIATVEDDEVHRGPNTLGDAAFEIEGDLEGKTEKGAVAAVGISVL
ncbi:MAG: hypothetical protein SV760_02335 [Halobacteria archaeon]|nr:hypothetical protein [Halobacteria archaeon]